MTGTRRSCGLDRRNCVLDQEAVIHRADPGQLRRLVVDQQEHWIFWRDEMVGDPSGLADWSWNRHLFGSRVPTRPKLMAIKVSSFHLTLMICVVA